MEAVAQAPLLKVDFTQEASTSLLPRSPLLSSSPLGWDGVLVQYHHQPAWEMPEYAFPQHTLSIHHLNHAIDSERVLDGKRRTEQLHQGDIALIPAHVTHQKLWRLDCHFTLIMLNPAHVAQIAPEIVDVDRFELVPHFAKADPLLYQIGIALKAELASPQRCSHLYVDALTTALVAHLLRHYATIQREPTISIGGLSNYQLEQVVAYIQVHLDQDIKLLELAKLIGISQYYFCRLFKQSIGITPYQYVLQQRVKQAQQLLKQRQFPIADIALQCGFTSQSHLNHHFKRLVGITPHLFLKQ